MRRISEDVEANISLRATVLIDYMVASALTWSVAAMSGRKNYYCDVQSDTGAQGYGSSG